MMERSNGRSALEHRPVEMVAGFQRTAEGSVLYRAGGTVVLCAVSADESLPKWMGDQQGGWLTADYQMHPRCSPDARQAREGRNKPLRGRTMEIQRLIGRALRGALDMDGLGRRSLAVDCDILEADGGTRTASVTGGFVALALALNRLGLNGDKGRPALCDQVAAVSVGHVDGEVLVDLDYREDSAARVDMNVVATARGHLVDVQATAEGVALSRADFNLMVDRALGGIESLMKQQRQALAEAGVELDRLLICPS